MKVQPTLPKAMDRHKASTRKKKAEEEAADLALSETRLAAAQARAASSERDLRASQTKLQDAIRAARALGVTVVPA